MTLSALSTINWKFLKAVNGLLIFILVLGVGAALHQSTDLTINMSESLKGKVFLIIKSKGAPIKLKRGDYVTFYHPWAPGLLIKQVRGIKGDRITHNHNKAFINEQMIGPIYQISRDQRKLTPGPQGVVPEGAYFVAGEHPRSFDSRYAEVGFLGEERIYGKAYKIF